MDYAEVLSIASANSADPYVVHPVVVVMRGRFTAGISLVRRILPDAFGSMSTPWLASVRALSS